MRKLLLFSVVISTAFIGLARAQDGAQSPPLSDEQVSRILQLALENLPRMRCEQSKPCGPATAEERANPPLTLSEARAIMTRGVVSGVAQQCGLDWHRMNFEPMMAYWRQTQRKNERQMAVVAMLHGIMQGMTGPKPGATAQCSDDRRNKLGALLRFVP